MVKNATFVIGMGMLCIAPVASFFLPWKWILATPPNATYEEIKASHEIFHSFLIVYMSGIFTILGFLIIYTFKWSNVPKAKKKLWAALIFFGSVFVTPFFWYWYIWKPFKQTRVPT